MGPGGHKPSKEFGAPVGRLTAAMTPEEEVTLLACIVTSFDGGEAAQEEASEAFFSGLEPNFTVIQSNCPVMEEGDVLLASEVLKPGHSAYEKFAVFLGALGEVDLEFILTKQKRFKEEANGGVGDVPGGSQGGKKTHREMKEEDYPSFIFSERRRRLNRGWLISRL